MGNRPRYRLWLADLSLLVDRFWVAAAVCVVALALGLAVTYAPGAAFKNVSDIVGRETVTGVVLYAGLPNPKLLHAHRRYTLVVRLDDGRVISASIFSHRIPNRGARVALTRFDHAIGAPVYNIVSNTP